MLCQKGNLGALKVTRRRKKNAPSSFPWLPKTSLTIPLGALLWLLVRHNDTLGTMLKQTGRKTAQYAKTVKS